MVFQQSTSYDSDGRLVCHYHNVPAVIRTSHTIDNPNRDFYSCPHRANEGPDNCGFFHWVDQVTLPPETAADIPHAAPRPAIGTPTNRPRHTTSPFLPSPTSPTKRASPFKVDEARQKRLKIIRDAISSPDESGSGSTGAPVKSATSARAQRISQTITEALRSPQSPNRFSPDKDQVMSTPSSIKRTYKLSELGLDIDGTRSVMNHEDDDDEVNFTPSSSAEKVALSLLRTPDESQGKRRAVEFDFEDDDDGQFWQDAPATATAQCNLFRGASPSPDESATVASPDMETFELSGDNIERIVASTMNSLSSIPNYVHMLERKVAAMEKSNTSKVRRIKELEVENQKLKSRQGRWSPSR